MSCTLHDVQLPQSARASITAPHSTAICWRRSTGAGFVAVLTVLGAVREILGQGSLLAGLPLLAGEWSDGLVLELPFRGMLAVVLPPGAFFGLAALIALRNYTQAKPAAA